VVVLRSVSEACHDEGSGVKPYYQDDAVTIYHGDCLDVLPRLSLEPDVVLTDPPYGIAYEAMRSGLRAIANDGSLEVAAGVIGAALAFVKTARAFFLCCDWRSLEMMRGALEENGIEPKACIVWDKLHPVQNLDRYGKQYELILYAGPFGGQPTQGGDVWPFARDYDPQHPTPKPVPLMARALLTSSQAGQLVVDPFMGSGATLRAAKNHGRRAIGIEIEERYCEIAAQRCAQDVLFADAA
jgi:site-specific DNA-methyltransferase (adenine-specific)